MGLISTKWTVVCLCSVGLIYYRNAFVIVFLVGGVISSILAKVLKYGFQEKRPTGVAADPGMPSSHSMNLFYLATYLCTCKDDACHAGFKYACNWSIFVLFFGIAAALSTFRIQSGHHTPEQIMAGASFGAAWALIWKYIVDSGLNARIERLIASLGDDHVLAVAVLLVVAGLVVTGPVERRWKNRFAQKES